jgi:branched-chain amino acid transport system substrate-binding protein
MVLLFSTAVQVIGGCGMRSNSGQTLPTPVSFTCLIAALMLLVACAPAAPSPTTPPKPTEAPKPAATAPPAAPAAAPTAAPAAKAAPSGRPIVIGGTLPLSGQFSGEASAFQKLADTWAEMVNEGGGLKAGGENRPIKFLVYDDASEQPKAVQLYEKLVTEDRVDMLIGPYSSPMTFAASTVADKHEIPFLAVEANSDAIYSRGLKWVVGVLDTGRNWSNQHFDMLEAEGKIKTMGVLTQDNLHTKETRESAVNNANKVGIEIGVDETLPTGTQDFSPVIAKLRQSNPDMVYVNAFETFAVPFVKQAKELGLKPKALHVTHHGGYLVSAVGGDAEQITGEHYWLPGVPGEGSQEFEQLLRRSDVSVEQWPWAAIRFPAYQVLRAAIEKAGSTDRGKLMETLKSIEVNTLGGTIKFDQDGRGTMNPYPSQIQGGKWVLVWPKEYTKAEWIFPRTAW